MIIKFRAKNFSFTDGAKVAIENKLSKLSDMFNDDTVFDVYIVKRDKDYKCEIKVQKGKDFIRAEESGQTIEFSVDNAIGTLKKRARKVKSMKITKKRGSDTLRNVSLEDSADETEVIDWKIERRKFIDVEIMTEEDAVLSMEMLNHSFFLFKNKDLDNKVCVIYRREVGYGLLETEIC